MAKLHRAVWALSTVFFLTLLLRPPLAAIGPLLPQIQSTMGLNAAQLGLLTSIPVLCFGFGAFAGPVFLRKFGLAGGFTIVLVVLTVTIATRVWFGFPYLLLGTVAMGLGIALSNVLFPTLIRAEFPSTVPRMTAAYTTMLSGFSAVASGIAIPLSSALGSWQFALALFAIPGLLGVFTWLNTVRVDHPQASTAEPVRSELNLWRHPLTWSIAAFFGLQSSNFYVMLNWLPSMMIDRGMSPISAGGVIAFMSMVGIPVGMVITANLKRIKNLTPVILAISAVTAVGLALFAIGPAMAIPASIFTGVGLSSSFPLSLALIGMKGKSQVTTTALSSVSQGVGYLLAAAAVFLAGIAHELFGSWPPVIFALIIASLVQSFAGIYAAKHPNI